MNDDERIAYLAGELDAPVDPAERAELDELRGLLADPAVWAEPHPDLRERVVDAIADAADTAGVTRRRPRLVRPTLLAVAASVLLVVGVAIVVSSNGNRSVEYAAALTGTHLAPGASGDVTLTQTASGWRIKLHATGLPRLDNGTYYEAWLKSGDGVLVPIGTFNQTDDVTLWAGVPPSGYPTLTVTRQLANGEQASSGQVVLAGVTHRTN